MWIRKRRDAPAAEPWVPGVHADLVRQLRESRMEIVTAFEIERRRIERDLHDGAQQHLVAAAMKLGELELLLDAPTPDTPAPDADTVRMLLAGASADVSGGLAALRETVAGVHSRLLDEAGLEAAVRDLANRLGAPSGGPAITVRVPHPLPEMPTAVASAAWYFVSEAVTNAVKHAPGRPISVLLAADATLHCSVLDEGPGGATITPGHGLAGMRERLGAFGGEMTLSSPDGGPTSLSASIPLLLDQGVWGVNRTESR